MGAYRSRAYGGRDSPSCEEAAHTLHSCWAHGVGGAGGLADWQMSPLRPGGIKAPHGERDGEGGRTPVGVEKNKLGRGKPHAMSINSIGTTPKANGMFKHTGLLVFGARGGSRQADRSRSQKMEPEGVLGVNLCRHARGATSTPRAHTHGWSTFI